VEEHAEHRHLVREENIVPTVLITGANRGLGLELARQYAADGWRVIACARRPDQADELQAVAAASGGRVTVHALDVSDHASIDALARELDGTPIDLLLNNAGRMGRESFAARGLEVQRFGESDYDDWLQTLRVNVLGPMKMAEAFADLVAASGQKKLVTLTSMVGSIGQNTFGGLYAYRSSKSAANAVMKCMAIDLRARGIIALPMHPGWVRTEIGGPRGELDTVTSVTGLRKVIAGLTPADAGRFLQWDGRELPW
jgi:NAD(P)-dependent dehydrogenase (short-subunit alcohol dehydrogenase family)